MKLAVVGPMAKGAFMSENDKCGFNVGQIESTVKT